MGGVCVRGGATGSCGTVWGVGGGDSLTLNRMTTRFSPLQLDVAAFAKAGADLVFDAAQEPATDGLARVFARLSAEACEPDGLVHVAWRAHAELRPGANGEPQPWVHLDAEAVLRLRCQRCLAPAELPVSAERWFRFVADEATAAAQDDESEEDVLALEPRFNLTQLVEDELLMAVPLVPMHGVCPEAVPTSVGEDEFQAVLEARPSAFAALSQLKAKT